MGVFKIGTNVLLNDLIRTWVWTDMHIHCNSSGSNRSFVFYSHSHSSDKNKMMQLLWRLGSYPGGVSAGSAHNKSSVLFSLVRTQLYIIFFMLHKSGETPLITSSMTLSQGSCETTQNVTLSSDGLCRTNPNTVFHHTLLIYVCLTS